jgi:hypothetical protein
LHGKKIEEIRHEERAAEIAGQQIVIGCCAAGHG